MKVMKVLVVMLVALLSLAVFAAPVLAQCSCQHGEVYLGYTATFNGKDISKGDIRNGAKASVSLKASDALSVELSLAANRGPGEQVAVSVGPKYNFNANGKLSPFVGASFGLVRTSFGSLRDAQFAWAAGGGLEIHASKRVTIRIAQVEYVSAKMPDGTQNRFRAGAGVAWRF